MILVMESSCWVRSVESGRAANMLASMSLTSAIARVCDSQSVDD
jgi:hypothetical protein